MGRSVIPRGRKSALLVVAALLLHQFVVVNSISFEISVFPSQKKCFGEHIAPDVLFRSSFTLVRPQTEAGESTGMSVSVADEGGTIFEERDKAEAHTAFTTRQEGNHLVCVENSASREINVNILLLWGADAKDYSQIAKMEHLDNTVQVMRHLEDELREYHQSLIFMRAREQRLRSVNETTGFRVLVFGFVNIGCVLLGATAQAYYFKRFFKQKKII
eukprot:Selendium_serpulae@DN5963_c0_g1_i3.p1